MTQPPCYDRINHKDCPDRQWCTKVGRSNCDKWTKYEEAYKAELEVINREKQIRSAEYELSLKARKRVHPTNRY